MFLLNSYFNTRIQSNQLFNKNMFSKYFERVFLVLVPSDKIFNEDSHQILDDDARISLLLVCHYDVTRQNNRVCLNLSCVQERTHAPATLKNARVITKDCVCAKTTPAVVWKCTLYVLKDQSFNFFFQSVVVKELIDSLVKSIISHDQLHSTPLKIKTKFELYSIEQVIIKIFQKRCLENSKFRHLPSLKTRTNPNSFLL